MSDVSISASGIAAISAKRFFEIGTETIPFLSGSPSGADYSDNAIAVGMDNNSNDSASEKTKADLTHLTVCPVIDTSKDRAAEDFRSFLETDAVLVPIGDILGVIPLEAMHQYF